MNQPVDLNAEVERLGDQIQNLLVRVALSPEDLIAKLLWHGYVFDLYYSQSGCMLFLEHESPVVGRRLSFHGPTDVSVLQQAIEHLIPRSGAEDDSVHSATSVAASHRPQ